MQTLDYEFEEQPLFTELGFGFAPVNGVAEISYALDGFWSVNEITLEGSKYNRERREFEHKSQRLCRQDYPWLYDAIVDSLENHSGVQDKVNEALESEGISVAPSYREHSTLNRAQQGV